MLKRRYRITTTCKVLIFQMALYTISIFIGYTCRVYCENKRFNDLIYPGIKVANFDLANKTKEEAKHIIKSKYINNILKKNINIICYNKIYTVKGSELILKHDIDKSIQEAFNFGKSLGPYEKNQIIKKGSYKEFNVIFTYDENYLKNIIDDIDKNSYKSPVNANIQCLSYGKFRINNDIKGYKLKKEELRRQIKSKIENELDNNINIKVPLCEINPKIKAKDLEGINKKISSYNTNIQLSSYSRLNNIVKATNAINGKIIMPNEIFSFNDCVGERTKERGFEDAPIIVNNEIESGIGGGICQVSSTLYNAVSKAGLKVIERKQHTVSVTYVPIGMDATVAWGNIDFKFKNNFTYPLLIEGYIKDNNLHINIYSNNSLDSKTDNSNNTYKNEKTIILNKLP